MKTVTTLGILVAASIGLKAQQHTETFTKELKFEQQSAHNTVILANINGSIEVQGYDGTTIQVEAKRTIWAKSDSRLQEAIAAVNVEVIDLMDTIIVYTSHPCQQYTNKPYGKDNNRGWGYKSINWRTSCEWQTRYEVDYVVKVPNNIHLEASTINDGDLLVSAVSGEVKARNINGAITLDEVKNVVQATTINGDVTIKMVTNPVKNARFYTLNGDIRADFKKGLSADMSFKSYSGDFYTNISPIENLPPTVDIEKNNKSAGISYKVNGKSMMRARSGGIHLDFETFNGDVFVKEF